MKSRTTRNIQIEKPAESLVAEGRRRVASVGRQTDSREEAKKAAKKKGAK